MKIELVPIPYVHTVWPDIEPHLREAFEKYGHGEYTTEQARAMAASGEWVLYVFTEGQTLHGAMLMQFFNRPNHRVAFVQCIGGRDVITEETFTQLRALSKLQGATVIECGARPAMARMLSKHGMEAKYQILGVGL